MKAVILAAGKSTRAYPLTANKPKPLVKVDGKTILERNLDQLKGIADEAIIIVGFKGELIKKRIGNSYGGIKVRYLWQKTQLGTGHALLLAEKFLKGRFIVMMGDDVYSRADILKCARHRYSVLAKKVREPWRFGVYSVRNGYVHGIVEKPKRYVSNLANCALYVLDGDFFPYLRNVGKSKRNEIEVTDAINSFSKTHKVKCVTGRGWMPFGYPWDLFAISRRRIGKNCRIGGKVVNSIVMDNTIIERGSIVRDSIIGENVRFSGIIKSGLTNVMVKDKRFKLKAGAVIGDNVCAENVVIYPGVRIWPGKKIRGEVRKDVI